MFGEQFGDARLICLRRGGGKGERHIAKPQVEQPIATSRLAVIIALGGGSTEDFDLTVVQRSEEHTSELQSLMRSSYAVFCLKKKIRVRRSHSCQQATIKNL